MALFEEVMENWCGGFVNSNILILLDRIKKDWIMGRSVVDGCTISSRYELKVLSLVLNRKI